MKQTRGRVLINLQQDLLHLLDKIDKLKKLLKGHSLVLLCVGFHKTVTFFEPQDQFNESQLHEVQPQKAKQTVHFGRHCNADNQTF